MAEYYPSHHPSREPSYRGDPMDEHAMRRSITRGSHQSHPSASDGTRSWVHSNQMNPPPPPDDTTPSPSPPLRRRRPLPIPDPSLHLSRSSQHYAPQDLDHEEHHVEMYSRPAGTDPLPFGYPTEELGDETPTLPHAIPIHLQGSPQPQDDQLGPGIRDNRSFVGGFFSGLKRLPKILRGGGSKQKLRRKGTFGTDLTDGSTTATAMTRGNTLPRYLSNPSIGPSNPQFAHRLSMAVANGSLPPGSTPQVFHVRQNQAGPHFPNPVVTVTPPSDGNRITEEQAEYFDGPSDEQADQFMGSADDQGEPMGPSPQERTTVMVYNNTDSRAPTIMPVPAPSAPPPHRQPTPGPRVSYPAQLPTRANVQAQNEHSSGPPLHAPTPMRPPGILQSPPNHVISPSTTTQATSSYTISAAPSFYDPSYSPSLTPVEKFFKGLYHLPWIAHERITVDYRPADSKRAQDKIRGLKKPMASWYRSLVPRSRRTTRSLDLLSSETGTMSSAPTSFGNPLTPLASPTSPTSRRSGRSSTTNPRSKPRRHKKKRHTMSSGTTVPRRTSSPIIPTSYPYTYPGYPYAYPYSAYPTAMPIPTSPRGPRKHKSKRTMKYPHGYAPYQPMAMPPMPGMPTAGAPLYFIAPSPPQSANGDEGSGNSNQPTSQQQPQPQLHPQYLSQAPLAHPPGMQVSPVIMHYVPGAFNPQNMNHAHTMASPPLTPQRPDTSGNS